GEFIDAAPGKLSEALDTAQAKLGQARAAIGKRISAPAAADAKESGTALARRLGSEGEARASIDPKAKVRIPSATNTASYRIPDALTDTTLTEVKNVGRQGLTSQIRDFMYYATKTGRRFDLIVRQNTVLTRELEDMINMTGSPINLIRGLPKR